jgi:anthranilate phosphoribosyltransferase
MFRQVLRQLASKKELQSEELAAVIAAIAHDELSDTQLAAFLMGLLSKGVTTAETLAIVQATRHYSVAIRPNVSEDLLDTCGTGGGLSTFNISTASAFVCAAAGIPVAKHGSRSVSSLCGSSEVLQALGVEIKQNSKALEQMIEQIGIAFIHAPDFNPMMRRLLPIETSLGIKTIFYTIVGPLINPALAKRHLLGVYRADLLETTAQVIADLGFSRAMVVHGVAGMDEISMLGETTILDVQHGQITRYTLNPEDVGLHPCQLEDIRSQLPLANAELIRDIFSSKLHGPARDAVLLNSAAGLMIGDRATNFADATQLAASLIDEGKVSLKLRELVMMSRDLASSLQAIPLPQKTAETAFKKNTEHEPKATQKDEGAVSASKMPQAASTVIDPSDPTVRTLAASAPSAQQIWQGLLESAPDAMVVFDQEAIVVLCNSAASTLYDRTSSQMLGFHYRDVVPPAQFQNHLQQFAMVQQQERMVLWEDVIHNQQLAHRLYSINDGHNIVLISRDISQQRQLESSEQNKRARLKTLIETLPDLIWLQDKAGRFMNCNHRFETFLGTTEALLKGRRKHDFLPKAVADSLFKTFEQALREQRAVLSRQWLTFMGDGHQEYVEIIQTPFFDQDGVLNGVMGIARDVTAFNNTADELTRHRDQLEDMVAERTQSLSNAVTELRQMQNQLINAEKVAALGNVVAGISHEMNTPVGNILTAITSLQSDIANLEKLFSHGQMSRIDFSNHLNYSGKMLDLAENSAQQTINLINNFKQLASDQIAEQRRSFSLTQLLKDRLKAIEPTLILKSIQVHNHLPEPIQCDSFPTAVGQIIAQLLKNCAQHAFVNQTDGIITIDAEIDQQQLQLSFRDNGCGMTSSEQIRIFDPFFSTAMSKSTGLGLPICKRLATGVLGGDLTVHSQQNGGSIFTLTMPLIAPGYKTTV